MTYYSKSDAVTYSDIELPYNTSLVVAASSNAVLSKTYALIANSLLSFYQPVDIIFDDGVTVFIKGNTECCYYLKGILESDNKSPLFISLFGTDVVIKLSLHPSIPVPLRMRLSLEYSNAAVNANATSFFSNNSLSINGHNFEAILKDNKPAIQFEGTIFSGKLLAYNNHYFVTENEGTQRLWLMEDNNSCCNAFMNILPISIRSYLTPDDKPVLAGNIFSSQHIQALYIHRIERISYADNFKIVVSTIENPTILFTLVLQSAPKNEYTEYGLYIDNCSSGSRASLPCITWNIIY